MRRVAFSVGGTLIMTVWAIVFGGVSGFVLHLLVRHLEFAANETLFSSIPWFVKKLVPPVVPLNLLSFGIASLFIPSKAGVLLGLAKLCAFRSCMGAAFLGAAGSCITLTIGLTTDQLANDPAPSYLYGLMVGWFPGFWAGMIWGTVEGTFRARKSKAKIQSQNATPPISAP